MAVKHEISYEDIATFKCSCGDPINPVLEMTAFVHERGRYVMAHARCVWSREAFQREGSLALPCL